MRSAESRWNTGVSCVQETMRNITPRLFNSIWTERPRQQGTRGEQRCYSTLVVIVCDHKSLQRFLPQRIIVGKGLLSWKAFMELQDDLPENVYLKRGGKGWNSTGTRNRKSIALHIRRPIFCCLTRAKSMHSQTNIEKLRPYITQHLNACYWHQGGL